MHAMRIVNDNQCRRWNSSSKDLVKETFDYTFFGEDFFMLYFKCFDYSHLINEFIKIVSSVTEFELSLSCKSSFNGMVIVSLTVCMQNKFEKAIGKHTNLRRLWNY